MPISNLGPSQRGADGRRRPDWQAQLGSNYLSPLLIGLAAAALLVVLLNSSLVRSLLALDAPFAAAPDPGLAELAEPTLSNCLFVGAPLLIGVYLLLSAITIDAIARRHFGRHYRGAACRALVVFPHYRGAASTGLLAYRGPGGFSAVAVCRAICRLGLIQPGDLGRILARAFGSRRICRRINRRIGRNLGPDPQ